MRKEKEPFLETCCVPDTFHNKIAIIIVIIKIIIIGSIY